MSITVPGVVHGQSISCSQPIGLVDGQVVRVTIEIVPIVQPQNWGEGLRRCEGAMAPYWTEEDDRILDEIQRSRKRDGRKLPE